MRYTASVLAALSAAVLAMILGYMHYKAAPIGDLFYTPMDQCPHYSHSFTTGYILALAAEAAFWITIAFGAWFISRFTEKRKTIFPSVLSIRSTLLGLSILLVAGLAHPIFEALLPLQADPHCMLHVP